MADKTYYAVGTEEGRGGFERFKGKVKHSVLETVLKLYKDENETERYLSRQKLNWAVYSALMLLTLEWAETERKRLKSFLAGKRKTVFIAGDGNYMALGRTAKDASELNRKMEMADGF